MKQFLAAMAAIGIIFFVWILTFGTFHLILPPDLCGHYNGCVSIFLIARMNTTAYKPILPEACGKLYPYEPLGLEEPGKEGHFRCVLLKYYGWDKKKVYSNAQSNLIAPLAQLACSPHNE